MIYFLDGNQEVIKIVRSSAVISAIQTQELPEDNSLLRDYLSVRLKNDERLFNAQYMAVKSYGGNRNAFDLYRIAGELVPDNATEFMGIQVAPYELEGVVIEDLRPQNRPLNQTMNQVLEGSDWRLGYVADNLPNVTTNFYYMSVKDTLKKIQELTNVEMLFKVEISGNKITDKWVEVYRQLGNRTMKRFNYGTNVLSVVRESSHDELYTALIGRGKGEEVSETESGDATYGRKIGFADVEWKKTSGNPVDKPKGQKYIELPSATAEYGIKLIDGRKVPRIGIVEFNDTDDPEKLIQETYQELLVRARPKVLFKASVINTGDMLIGDTVTIHRHDLDFHYQARVRKVVRDRKSNNKTQVEIGDVVHTASTKRQGQINSALNNITSGLDSIRGEVTEARQSADGKNTNFYGNVEPDRKKVGDTWFRDHPSLTGESQILVWNGEAWELIMDTSDTTKNAREIEKAMEEVEEAKQQAKLDAEKAFTDARAHADAELERINTELSTDIGGAIDLAEQAKQDAIDKANQALADAKAHADAEDARIKQEIGLEVDGAIEIAEQAKQDAIDKANQALEDAKAHADSEILQFSEHFDGVLAEVESDVVDAQATADSAIEQIDTAVANAGFTSLDDTLQSMNYITMNAEQNAQQAITDANNAYGLAQTSISEAQTAQENSLTALGQADNALDGVSNLDVRVDEVEAEVALKADNTFMTEDGELTTLSNAITFNAHRFSSDMSRIESRVESLAGEINLVVLRDAIKDTRLMGGEVYPNTTPYSQSNTMREMINVTPGEKLALSKETPSSGYNYFTINYYDENYVYKSLLHTQSNQQVITIPPGIYKMWVAYPAGSKPQIVRGTQFVPYRPNMADQMTTDEMVLFRNEYDEYADRTERRLSAIDSTGGSLDVLNNRIVTTAEQVTTDMTALISTKVGEDEFTEFYQNEYLETAQEVSRKISLSDVEVGGRNYAIWDDMSWGYYSSVGTWVAQSENALNRSTDFIPVLAGEKIIISSYDDIPNYSGTGRVILWDNNKEFVKIELSMGNGWAVPNSYSFVVPNGVSFITGTLVYWGDARYKIEKGNIATDWTPAPEDTTALINYVESELTQKYDSITATVSNIDGRVTQQRQDINGLTTTVQSVQTDLTGTTTLLNTTKTTVDSHTSSIATLRTDVNGKATTTQFNTLNSTVNGTIQRVGNAEGKITQIETSISGIQTTVAGKASQSQVTQLENGLSSVVSNFKNILPDSLLISKPVPQGTLIGSLESSLLYRNIPVKPNTTYTLSYNKIPTSPDLQIMTYTDYDSDVTSHNTAYRSDKRSREIRVSSGGSFTTTDSEQYIFITTGNATVDLHYVDYRRLQLEEGSEATDWTRPYGALSQISQLADNINLRVTKGDVISQINIEAEQTLIQTGKLLLDAKNTIVTGDFAVSGNAIVGGDMQLNKGLRVMDGTNSVLSVVNGNVRMNVGSLFIGSEDVEDKISTAIYQNSKSLGLIYTDEAGQEQSLLSIGADGVYVEGKHIILNGQTVVTSDFTVTGGNVVLDADTTILGDFTVSGGNVILDADTIVTGDFAVLGENIILDGNTTVRDNFTVTGGNIILDGDTTVHNDFTVTGGNVVLDADTRVQGDFTVSGGNVILDGNTTVRGGFTVLGENVTLDANTTVLGDFSVFGENITLDGDTTILGDFSVFGENIILDGDVTVTEDFTVAGDIVGSGIRADNITTGELDAGQITVVNLDVSSLSGNKTEFVRSSWNNINDSITIDGSGIVMVGNNIYRRNVFNAEGINLYGDYGAYRKAGAIGYFRTDPDTPDNNANVVEVEAGHHHYIGMTANEGYSLVLGFRRAGWGDRFYRRSVIVSGDTGTVTMFGSLSMRNLDGISWIGGGSSIHEVDQHLEVRSKGQLRLYNSISSLKVRIGANFDVYSDLNMNDNNIYNNSDVRLKKNITPTSLKSLNVIKQWSFVDYEWRDEGSKGTFMGVIAQDTPEIASYNEETGFYAINSSKQLMMTTHGLHELALNHDVVAQLAKSNESKIHKLQQELSQANRRIEELEGAI